MDRRDSRTQRWTVVVAVVLGAIVGVWSARSSPVLDGVGLGPGTSGELPPVVDVGPPAEVRGRVLLETERPEDAGPETPVELTPPAFGQCLARAWQEGRAVTEPGSCEADGSFSLRVPGDVVGKVAVEMLVPGRLRGVVETTVASGQTSTLPTVALGFGQRVAGEVLNRLGQPIAGAQVQAMPEPNLGEPEPWRTESDQDGRFAFETLPPGPIIVRGWKRGYATSVGQTIAPSEDVLLTLDAFGKLQGRVAADEGLLARTHVRLEGSAIWPALEVKPEADGTFVFEDVPDGVYGLEAVVVAGEDDDSEWSSFPLENVLPTMYVTLGLVEAHRVPVRVVDTGGNPIPRARVTLGYSSVGLLQRVAEADVLGRAEVGPVIAGPYVVRADADGFLPADPAEVDVHQDGTVDPVTLVLARPARIEGRVVDADGRGVAGATVIVDSDGVYAVGTEEARADVFRQTLQAAGALGVTTGPVPDIPVFGAAGEGIGAGVESGPEGAFVVGSLLPGSYTLRAVHGRYAQSSPLTVRLASGEIRRGVNLLLGTGYHLTGRVLDGNRRPVVGAELEFADGASARTDGRGVFDGGHRRGRQRIVLRAPGMAPREVEITMDADRDFEIELEPADAVFSGVVRDPNGQPVVDARVRLQFRDGLSPTLFAWTDDRGGFEFDRLPPGAVEVVVDHPDYAEQSTNAVASRERDRVVELQLIEGWSVDVLIRDLATGEPISGATVRAGGGFESTDPDGRATFARLPGRQTSVVVDAEGYSPGRRTLVRDHLDEDPVVIELDAGGGMEGETTDYRGDPVPHVRIVIQPEGHAAITTQSDGQGRWRVTGVPEGDVVIKATPPAARAAELARTTVTSDVIAGHVTKEVQIRFDRH